MILRRDHIAGGAFVAGSMLVYAASGDLPFGSLASPGAGMLPTLVLTLTTLLGFALLAGAGGSPPLTSIDWSDAPHALRVVVACALATALYVTLGFLATMSLLLFGLIYLVERRAIVRAAMVSLGVALVAYAVFGSLLKSPLPRGLIWF
ncbi:MAG: tripartite tricarboxylate transporter TctB family protein [Proteobacteria bacterium]|nr:tripartite tricarboxylate transporter TctB family protein [Pseudomonadota bacterium]